MITTQHNDGSCFKLTIEYTDYESEPFEKYIRYGEDFSECLTHGIEYMQYIEGERACYVIDFRIQDDSK